MRYLRKARVDRGYSQAALAAELQLAVGTIHRLETNQPGAHPSTRRTLSDFFGVTFETLMEEVNEDGSPKGEAAAQSWKHTGLNGGAA